jgi:hypothetical protein
MTIAWICPVVIIAALAVLLSLNAPEFKVKRRGLEAASVAAPTDDAALTLVHAVLSAR